MQELGHRNSSSARIHVFFQVMPSQFFPCHTAQMDAIGRTEPPSHIIEPSAKRNAFEIKHKQLTTCPAPARITGVEIVVDEAL